MKNFGLAESHTVADEVKVNLNMLGPLVLDRILGHVHGAHIVAVDNRGTGGRMMQLLQELADPTRLGNTVSNSTVFSFSTGARNRGLPSRRPRDQVITEENTKAGGGFPSIRAARPISIGISNKIKRRPLVELQAKMSSATDIAQDAFDELKMDIARSMHE
jgi:hypothetical protein